MVSFAPGSAPLSARPPTPPKDNHTKLAYANEDDVHPVIVDNILIDTPEESPASSAEYFKGSSEIGQKKVVFSPWTKFHNLPISGSRESDSESSIRHLPPSKECKSLKSILKACTDNTTYLSDSDILAFDRTSLSAMLRSTVQHLRNPSRASRLDAYTTLFACLSAYDEVPETKDLCENIAEITGYIRRDVSMNVDLNGNLDTQLATQALKVFTIFLSMPSLAVAVPEDFCTFILDRSISSIEDAGSSKLLVTHHMHLLEKQNFSAKQMTADRVNKLLTALDSVTSRMKGNRIICHRLMIYQRLLLQSKSVMAARFESWINNLISGMLSTLKDVRIRAIAFGVEAGLKLGTVTSVSQACAEIFNRTGPGGERVVDFLCNRLGEMTATKEDGVHAAQIWSVVILFFRSRRRQLECWEHMKAWLIVIQRCLNCSDPQIKFQANLAWSRLIYVVNPDASTSISMIKMLRQPLLSQLERKANDKTSKQAKQIARSTYCTLLYYAFRPTATHAQLDQYWETYVAQILPTSFLNSKSDVNQALEIMAALLSPNGKPKIWDENRANMSGPVKPEELTCLEPKWVRSRADSIAKVYDKLSELADWRGIGDRESSVVLAWRSFMTALGIASSKEVKVSMDAMNAVSTVINLLKRLLERCCSKTRQRSGHQSEHPVKEDKPDVYIHIASLLQEAVAKIGTIPFLERRLVLTSQDAFEAAETPSSRSNRDSSSLNSPVTHLLRLLLKNFDHEAKSSYVDSLKVVVQITLQSAHSRWTKLMSLRNLARHLPLDEASDREATLILWQLIAEETSSAVSSFHGNDPHNGSPQPPGREFREAVKILELGIQLRSVEILPMWEKLCDCITQSLRKEVCDEALILMVIEPLADIIRKNNENWDQALLSLATVLLKTIHWPQSAHSIDRAQNLLWGVGHTTHRSKLLKPSESLCSVVNTLLGSSYDRITDLPAENLDSLLSGITSIIRSCPPDQQESFLVQTQSGLAAWIEDARGILSSANSSPLNSVCLKVKNLSSLVSIVIEQFPNHNTRLLFNIRQLVLSGLKSRHRSIVNQFILLWNRTFGCAKRLEYPEELCGTLFKFQCTTDIQLPSFPAVASDEAMSSSPIRFVESQEDTSQIEDYSVSQRKDVTESSLLPFVSDQRAVLPNKDPKVATSKLPLSSRRRVETTPKARLRHADSQIQFAAIESSPLGPEPIASQDLTDRQKEVKERQGLEAAMFPEIRSSPKSASRPVEYSLPKLVFKSDRGPSSKAAVDEQTSPAYPPDMLMNDYLGSSPTPASSKKGTNSKGAVNGPPSSPPLLSSSHKAIGRMTPPMSLDLPDEAMNVTEDFATSPSLKNKHKSILERDQDVRLDNNTITEIVSSTEHRSNDPVPAAAVPEPEDRMMSDFDFFVDAPSEPTAIHPPSLQGVDTRRGDKPDQANGLSNLTSEDDQVAAQLMSEMERASSQRSSKEEKAVKLLPRDSTKRKSPFPEDTTVRKKIRATPNSSQPAQQSQASTVGQDVAECVMIDVRPSKLQLPDGLIQVKKEKSPSPSVLVDIRPARKSLVDRKGREKPLRRSRPSQPGGKTSSNLSSPRQDHVTPESNADDVSAANDIRMGVRKSARKPARLKDAVSSSPPESTTSAPEAAISESGSLTNLGKRKTSRFWYYVSEGSEDEAGIKGNEGVSDQASVEVMAEDDKSAKSEPLAYQQPLSGPPYRTETREVQHHGCPDGKKKQDQETSEGGAAVEVGMVENAPTAEGIVQGFRKMLSNIKRVTLGREDEREISKLLFQSMEELHEAGRRHTAS